MTAGLAEQIDELAARWRLQPDQVERLTLLVRAVRDLSAAPTTIRTTEAILRDHLADSLVALAVPEVSAAHRLADIGSGPGFPGLPLALALPQCQVHLVESSQRKCGFLETAIRACQAGNVRVVCARVEEWAATDPLQDVVTARALAPPGVVAEYAAPLLRLGGVLVAWRGRLEPQEDAVAARAAAQLGMAVEPPCPVRPYAAVSHRHLQIFRKVEETPSRFPRRPGMARKRPLGEIHSGRGARS